MKRLILRLIFAAAAVASPVFAADRAPAVQELQNRMLADPDIMALIIALQAEPEMQAMLQEPALLEAILSGDSAAVARHPRLKELLANPKFQEIRKRLERR